MPSVGPRLVCEIHVKSMEMCGETQGIEDPIYVSQF